MRAIEINLLSYSYTKDEIGQEVKVVNKGIDTTELIIAMEELEKTNGIKTTMPPAICNVIPP